MRNNGKDLRTLIMEQHMVIDGYQFPYTVIKGGRSGEEEERKE